MTDRPNLLFIMPDQLRHDFLSCYGAGDFIQTPHIDRIANEGVRFDCAYSQHPLCVPARVSLLTGMNAIATGVGGNGNYLRPDYEACGVRTWAQMLSNGGYYTSAIGKMHSYPWDLDLGFQHRVGAEDKRWLHIEDDYFHFLRQQGHRKYHGNEHAGYLENRGAIVSLLPWECYWDHFVGREATEFLQAYDRDEPFALMVGFPGPHCPYDPTPEYLSQFEEGDMPAAIPEVEGEHPGLRQSNISSNKLPWNGVDYSEFTEAHKRKIRAHYAALVKQIDDDIGQMVQTLEARGMLDNTVIIFASDHGDCLGDHNLIGKGTFFEASTHVPLMVRAPGVKAGQVRDDLVALTDVTATLLSLGGCDVPKYMAEDSRPLPGVCAQDSGDGGRDILFGALDGGWMAFDGKMKLSKYAGGEQMLFNLAEDPTEQHNLMRDGAHGDICRRLDGALTRWVMASMSRSHVDKLVYTQDLSADLDFAKPGWARVYPNIIEGS